MIQNFSKVSFLLMSVVMFAAAASAERPHATKNWMKFYYSPGPKITIPQVRVQRDDLLLDLAQLIAKWQKDLLEGARTSSLNDTDEQFIRKDAALGAMQEVVLGGHAMAHASAISVQEFGKKMLQDHSAEYAAIDELGKLKGIGEIPVKLTGKYKDAVESLTKLSGAEFDKKYMQYMVEDHVNDISRFKQEIQEAQDKDVKKFAEAMLPVLESHLSLARAVKQIAHFE